MAARKAAAKKSTRKPMPLMRRALEYLSQRDGATLGGPLFYTDRQFNNCCGMIEFGGFAYNPDRTHLDERLAYQIKRTMQDHRVNAAMCTTTLDSSEQIRESLERIGFRTVGHTINPKTHNEIAVWLYSERQ